MPADEWMNKMWYNLTRECYSAINRNKVLTLAVTQMNLGNMLSERSQIQKVTYCMNHSYKIPSTGQCIETERLVIVRCWEEAGMVNDCSWTQGFLFGC